MREHEFARQQRLAYEKLLYRYNTALERGDIDTVIALLNQAESDSRLEQLILETHTELQKQEEKPLMNTDTTRQPALNGNTTTRPVAFQPERKRRKRVFLALQSIAAVLVVVALIGGAMFVFSSLSKHAGTRPQGPAAPKSGAPQVGDIVVTASLARDTDESFVTARSVQDGAFLWRYSLKNTLDDAGRNGQIGLLVQDHVVYLAYNGQVKALQAKDGKLLWEVTLGKNAPNQINGDNRPQLVIDHGQLYASGYVKGNLYTLNPKNGEVLWHYDAPISALLAMHNGRAFVLTNDDNDKNAVKALDGKDGHELWHYNTTMPLSATVADDVLYVQAGHEAGQDRGGTGKDQKPLIALNINTGKAIWSKIAPASGPSPLAVAQGVVVVFEGTRFCGYSTKDGNQAWCTAGPKNTVSINGSALVSYEGTIYGLYKPSFEKTELLAINPKNGALYWSKDLKERVGYNPQILASADSLILPGDKLVLKRSDGKVLWQIPGNEFVIAGASGN